MNPAEVKIGHLLVIKLILQPPNILDVSSFVGFGGKATSRYLAAQSQLESAKLAFHEVDKHIFEWFLGMPWEIFMGCQWDFNGICVGFGDFHGVSMGFQWRLSQV